MTVFYWSQPREGEPDLDSDPPAYRYLGTIEDGEFSLTLDAGWDRNEMHFVPWAEVLTHQSWQDRRTGTVGPNLSRLADACPEYVGRQYVREPDLVSAVIYTFQVQDDGTLAGTRESREEMTIGSEIWTETHGPDPITATRLDP